MKKLLFCAMLLLATAAQAEVAAGKTYRIITTRSYSMFVNNASLDANADVVAWMETSVPAQRWVMEELTGGKVAFRNAYTGYYLAYNGGNAAGTKIAQRVASSTRTSGAWLLEPVEGTADTYLIYVGSNKKYCIGISDKAANGVGLQLMDPETADATAIQWRFVEDNRAQQEFNLVVRDDIMSKFINRFYKTASTGHVLGNGGWWGDAEMFEIILDAFETTGDKTYQTYWDELYRNFCARNLSNWFYNEYNDDITWMVLACIRAYKFFGDVKYLNSAKDNYDRMYARAKQPYGTLIWKQSQENKLATNSCINCPATVAACYLAQLTGDKTYYDKALSIYAGQRKLLFDANTGQVYDSRGWTSDGGMESDFNRWSSTYNQGTMLGAALMLYDYTKDPIYKQDAERIYNWSYQNLCNKYHVVHVCQTIQGDLCGFKGIFMRYARRYAEDLGHPEVLDWMALNAWHGYQNRNTAGIIWSAWLTKTSQDLKRMEGDQEKTCEPFSASTIIAAAFNAHINGQFYKNAYATTGAELFDEIQWMQIADNSTDDTTPETTLSTKAGSYIAFKNVDFGKNKANRVNLRVKGSGNTKLQVYVDSISTTTLIGETTGYLPTAWSDVTVETAPVSGQHHVYFVTTEAGRAALHHFTFDSTNMLYADLTDNGGTLTVDGQKAADRSLVDNDPSTSATVALPTTLVYTSPAPMTLKGYALFAAPAEGQKAPAAWTLEASNDGSTWTKLDEQRGKTFATEGQKHLQTVSTTTAYTMVRLTLHGSSDAVLADWQLYGTAIAPADITDDGGTLTGLPAALTDNDPTTTVTSAAGSTTVEYAAAMKYTVGSYAITVDQAEGAPQAWTLYGSVDGTTWTALDSQTAQRFAYAPCTNGYLLQGGDCRYFRFVFDALPDGSPLRIAELQLFGTVAYGKFHNDILSDGGKTTASDGSDPEAIADNDPMTIASVSGSEMYWQHQATMPTRYRGFSIVAGSNPDRFPTSISVQGSADGQAWTTLTTVQPKFATPYERFDQMSSNVVYNHYRLLVNSVADGGTTAELAEWELHGTAVQAEGERIVTVESVEPENLRAVNDGSPTTIISRPFESSLSIDYHVAKAETVGAYALTAASNYVERDPASWVLYGSADGENFEELDRRDDIDFATRYATQFYPCNAGKKAYSHYRLDILSTGSSNLQLSEWQLLRPAETTGIARPPSFPPRGEAANGEVSPRGGLEGASIYDLQGRKVASPSSSIRRGATSASGTSPLPPSGGDRGGLGDGGGLLKPGIYIVGGKKVVVR